MREIDALPEGPALPVPAGMRYQPEARASAGGDAGMKKRANTEDGRERSEALHAALWESPEGRLCFRMGIWGNFFNLKILPILDREFGILRDEFNILLCLVGVGKLTGTDICRIVGRPRNSISRCADRLIQRKLIKALPTSGDKRQTLYEILPEGRRLYRAMMPYMVALEAEMLVALDPEEHKTLDRLLTKLMGRSGQSNLAI